MTLDEIVIAFSRCNGDANRFFKDYRTSLLITDTGTVVIDACNYILKDVEQLLNKALLNVASSDLLLRYGYFSWGFVSSYYANFYCIQALNRLQLNFLSHDMKCKVVNYLEQEIEIKKQPSSKGASHLMQFQDWETNRNEFLRTRDVDRYWTIGLGKFEELSKYGNESNLRNAANYHLSINDNFYYEFEIREKIFADIIKDNKLNSFSVLKEEVEDPFNYSRRNLKIAIARCRVLIFTLNYLANKNIEYTSYYERNMLKRRNALKTKYPDLSAWISDLFIAWLQLKEI